MRRAAKAHYRYIDKRNNRVVAVFRIYHITTGVRVERKGTSGDLKAEKNISIWIIHVSVYLSYIRDTT